jgi:signal transduction protein with GAF and PtsI domain
MAYTVVGTVTGRLAIESPLVLRSRRAVEWFESCVPRAYGVNPREAARAALRDAGDSHALHESAAMVTNDDVGSANLGKSEVAFLHEIGTRFAAADSLQSVLNRVVHFVSSVVQCDSCFIYVLENDELVVRAWKDPHADVVNRLRLRVGQGLTGWVAEHRQPVAVGCHAFEDPRYQIFNDLPEDQYEAFLSVPVVCRGRLVAVINLQHRHPHDHSRAEIQLIATIGFLVGAEIALARLESENSQLSERLETRKIVERAKGILQRDLGIGEEEAYLTIQRQSRQRRRTKRDIAEAILLADDLRQNR